MIRFLTFCGCLALYLALTGNLAPSNWLLAVIFGAAATVLARPPHGKRYKLAQWPRVMGRKLWWVGRYGVALIIDIIKCGITVAQMIIDPKLPIRPGLIMVSSGSPNETITAISGHGITVTPGEQVIEFGDHGEMFVHCLDEVSSAASAEAAQAKRRAMLEKVFL